MIQHPFANKPSGSVLETSVFRVHMVVGSCGLWDGVYPSDHIHHFSMYRLLRCLQYVGAFKVILPGNSSCSPKHSKPKNLWP